MNVVTRVLVTLGALVLLSSLSAGAQAKSSPSGLFVFSRTTAPPQEAVIISTARAGEFSRRDRVSLYLVPRAIARDVGSAADERITAVGSLRTDRRGQGSLRVRVPDVAPGQYLVGRSCPRCKKRIHRRFAVLQPAKEIPVLIRSRMALRVDDVRRCNTAYSEAFLNRFFSAFNSASAQIAQFFVPEDRWIWWRDPNNMADPVPYGALESYLRTLHASGIRLGLQSLSFTGYRAAPRLGEFGLRLDRGDQPAGNGKVAIDCGTGLLALVTIDSW
jgi:hypothetical protein